MPPLISTKFFLNSHKIILESIFMVLSRLVQSLCQTTADLHKKNPRATAARPFLKERFIIAPWLCPLSQTLTLAHCAHFTRLV